MNYHPMDNSPGNPTPCSPTAKIVGPPIQAARCPRCSTLTSTRADGRDRWYCHRCKMEFESEDDGTVGYGPPDRRMRREEARRERRKP